MKYSLIEGFDFTVGGTSGAPVGATTSTPPTYASYTTSSTIAGHGYTRDSLYSGWPGSPIANNPDFYAGSAAEINSNSDSITANLGTHTALNNADNLKKSDTIDDYGNLIYKYDNNNPSPNTRDVLLQDNNDILVQQNMTYIIGMIAASTLIISAIMISRK